MNRTTLIILLVCVAFAPLVAWLVYTAVTSKREVTPTPEPGTTTPTQVEEHGTDADVTGDVSDASGMTIEEYVRENISALSPEPEVLGGTYYVTEIEAHGGAGTVSYEDGHVAHTADFSYEIDEFGKITITSFVIRPVPVPR